MNPFRLFLWAAPVFAAIVVLTQPGFHPRFGAIKNSSKMEPQPARQTVEKVAAPVPGSVPPARDETLSVARAGFNQPEEIKILAVETNVTNLTQTNPLAECNLGAAIQEIIKIDGAKNPAAVADWLNEFPAGEMRDSGLKTLLFNWANLDFTPAQQWVSTRLSGAERDQFMTQLVEWKAQSDLPAAASLVIQMSPGPAQTDLATGILRRWTMDDSFAVSQWLNQLPYDSQQFALAQLQKMATEPQGDVNY